MNIDELTTDKQSTQAELRTHWALFRMKPLSTLEEFLAQENGLDPSIKASLVEFIQLRRRLIKIRLDTQETLGKFLEELAIVAGASIGITGFALTTVASVLPEAWSKPTLVGFGVVGVITWLIIRQSGIRRVLDAREQRNLLGHVK